MAMIPLTTSGENPCRIFISSAKIVSITPQDHGSVVMTSCADGEHAVKYCVSESVQHIVDVIHQSEVLERQSSYIEAHHSHESNGVIAEESERIPHFPDIYLSE